MLSEAQVAELSRLKSFALRVGPIVKAAVELRQLGRTLEALEADLALRKEGITLTRSGTPWLIVQQAYVTALEEFDAKVKAAALGNYADLLGGNYDPPAGRSALEGEKR